MFTIGRVAALISGVFALYVVSYFAKEAFLGESKPMLDHMAAETNCAQPFLDRRYTEALEPCVEAAKRGFPMAQAMVGEMYLFGHAVPKDASKAYDLALPAAQKEQPNAQFVVGKALLEQNISPEKTLEGIEWLRKAANNCHRYSPLQLALLYDENDGPVEPDITEAFVWAMVAAFALPPGQNDDAVKYRNHLAERLLTTRSATGGSKSQ